MMFVAFLDKGDLKMSKYERFIIYPLLLTILVYGFIGNPAIQASQEKEVFNQQN